MIDMLNHITDTACDQVASICANFFKMTGITYYNYVRVYNDTSRICMSNNHAWMKFVFSNLDKYFITFEEHVKHIQHGASHYIIWDNVPSIGKDILMQHAYCDFNIAHGFTIISNYSDYLEFQYFATTRDRQYMNQFYLNNFDVLHASELYFKDKAHKLIQQAETQRFKIEGHTFFRLEAQEEEIFYNLKPQRFYLSGELKDVFLTLREAQCLVGLSEGLSVKAIARKLGISYRTVQGHFDNVKPKLGCNIKDMMLKKIKPNGISYIADAIGLFTNLTFRTFNCKNNQF